MQTWTFTSSCSTPAHLHGRGGQQSGLTAPLEFRTSRWISNRFHPDWQRCADGSTAPVAAVPVPGDDANGQWDTENEDQLTGYDRTITEERRMRANISRR